MKLRIKATIRLAIVVLVASYLALLLLVQWTGYKTKSHLDLCSRSLFPASLSGLDASAAFGKYTKAYSDALMAEDTSGLDKAEELGREVLDSLRSIKEHESGLTPQRQQQVSSLLSEVESLETSSRQVYPEVIKAGTNASPESWEQIRSLGKENEHISAKLVELRKELASDFQAQLDSVNWWSNVQRIFGLGLGLIVIASTVWIIRTMEQRVSAPLQQLTTRFKDIAGDLTGADHGLIAEDEIVELDRSFSAMVSHLQDMAAATSNIANGDLSQDIVPRSEHDLLGKALAQMSKGLAALVRTVADSASQVASGATQVAVAADESSKVGLQASEAIDNVSSTMHEMNINVQGVVRGMEKQASNVSQTSASINQMVASIQRVSDTTGILLEISGRSRREADDGIVSMNKATDGLNRINSSIQSTADIVDTLGHRANEIGKIVDVIDDLAEQTNLLALNAAIEAARAGEHGLGFAVVADEIRKLSERSAQSTKEISELIESIQKETQKAVGTMNKSLTIVDEGLALGANLNGALERIASVVTEVYKFAEEIRSAASEQASSSSQIGIATNSLNGITMEVSSAISEQAAGTDSVVNSLENMRQMVQHSSTSSVELAAQADQMSTMSRKLLEVIDRFKISSSSAQVTSVARPQLEDLKETATTIKPLPLSGAPGNERGKRFFLTNKYDNSNL